MHLLIIYKINYENLNLCRTKNINNNDLLAI